MRVASIIVLIVVLCGCAVSGTQRRERVLVGPSIPVVDDKAFAISIVESPPVAVHVSCESVSQQYFMISPLIPLPPVIPFPDERKPVIVYLYLQSPALSYDPKQFTIHKAGIEVSVSSFEVIEIPPKGHFSKWRGFTVQFLLNTSQCKDLDRAAFRFGTVRFEGKDVVLPTIYAEYKMEVHNEWGYLSK